MSFVNFVVYYFFRASSGIRRVINRYLRMLNRKSKHSREAKERVLDFPSPISNPIFHFLKGLTHSLFGKLLLVTVLGILVPLLGLGIFLTRTGEEAVKATVLQNHRQIARRAASEIEAFLREPLSVLETTAEMMVSLGGSTWQRQAALVALSLERPIFKEISLVDTAGKEILTSDPAQSLRDRSEDRAFIEGMKAKAYLSVMYLLEGRLPTMTISVPVKDVGTIQGVLIAQLDTRGIWALVDGIKIGKTGNVSVFSRRGLWVAHPDKGEMVKEKAQQAKSIRKIIPKRLEIREPVAKQINGNICAAAPVPGSDWVVLTVQSKQEALDMARKMKDQHRLFLFLGFILSILIGWGTAYSVSRPIKTLSNATKRISQGESHESLPVGRQDEIGELTLSFNRMVGSLEQTLSRLRATRDFSDKIVENIPAGLLVLDKEMKVQRTNQAMVMIIGAKRAEDLIGRAITEILGSQKKLVTLIGKGLKGQLFRARERRVKTLDGREIEAVVTGAPFFGPGGEIESILLLVQDVTEQRKLEHELVQSEKLASVGLMSAGISHELKNPLNSIRWAVSEIEENLKEKDLGGIEQCTRSINTAIKRCSTLINNLLDFTRPSPKRKEKVDINGLLDSVLLLSEEQIHENKIEVKRNYRSIPKVEVNLDLMKQVFLNLVTNAIQAMPEGGVLDLATGQDRPDRLWARISDTGQGIPEKDLGNIFTPFFRHKEGGTGLGLWVVYSSIQRYGGDIRVESKEGEGSTFMVELPVG